MSNVLSVKLTPTDIKLMDATSETDFGQICTSGASERVA